MEYNIYCDESCHLENDNKKAMVLGAIWCGKNDKDFLFQRIKDIKKKHNLTSSFEIKWNKVSKSKIAFYKELINFFFDTEKLHFRSLVVSNKNELNHAEYNQTHDEFYYKMYFDMLKVIIIKENTYNIYLDIKDTQGYEKVEKLHNVIANAHYDFSKNIIKKIQEVDSKHIVLLQLADLLIGALSYFHRDLNGNEGKNILIDLIRKRSGYTLKSSSLPSERKYNIFIWNTGYLRKK